MGTLTLPASGLVYVDANNDAGFRGVASLPLVILDDLLIP